MKLYVAMVGLPARGKSTLAKRIRSGLEQQGIRTAIFNNGELRRMLFGLESGSAEFFNPDNTRAQRLRDQITHQNMERARAWLDEGGDVAIIDATNGTVHQRVDLSATLRDRPVLFIECVNDDPLLLDASIRRKTRLPEFANMTQEEALESFRKRLAYYESVYTSVRKERCWIRVDAVDSCIQDEAPSNDLPYYAAIRDIISSRWVQDLYLVRHGETDYNREGRLGGDPSLTAKGIEQAEKLAAHFTQAVDQPGAAAGIVNAHQVHFLKSKVSHIKSPFPHSFWVLSFCVLLWAGFSAGPQRISSFPVPPDERRQPSPSGKWADRFGPAVPALPP